MQVWLECCSAGVVNAYVRCPVMVEAGGGTAGVIVYLCLVLNLD